MRYFPFFKLSFLLFLIIFFLYRYETRKQTKTEKDLRVTVEGSVVDLPYVKGSSQYVALGKIRVIEANVPLRLEEVQLRLRLFPEFFCGDRIRASGMLSPYRTMRFPEIDTYISGRNSFRRYLCGVRKKFERRIESALPQDEASLLAGILLGSEGALSSSLENIYRRAGLTHVVVASGYNMTVLTEALLVVSSPLGLLLSGAITIFGLFLYAMILGLHPPVIRAALMSAIGVYGLVVGRKKDVIRALFFSAAVMLLLNPAILDSLSFQLSFASTFGLVFLGEPIQELMKRFFRKIKLLLLGNSSDRYYFYLFSLPNYVVQKLDLNENFSSSLAATIFVYPIISFYFGRFSLISFFANTLLLWLVPLAMMFGLLAILVIPFGRFLFKLLLWFAWPFLRIFNLGANKFSSVPLFVEYKISTGGIIVYYSFLFVLCTVFSKYFGTSNSKKV